MPMKHRLPNGHGLEARKLGSITSEEAVDPLHGRGFGSLDYSI